jgi:truncated hemoglobin YjbI
MNENIPNGDFLISTILGEEKSVDINALIPFEITETEAKQYLETEIQQGLEDVEIPLTDIIQSSFLQKPQIDNHEEFIIDLISKIKNNPELAKLGLGKFIQQFQQILNSSLSENSSELELKKSYQQIQPLQDVFREHGIDMGDLLNKFPQNLQKMGEMPNRYTQEISAKLQEFSQKIDVDNEEFQQVLLSFIKTYEQLFINEEKEAEITNKQQEDREKIIDKTIKESLEKHPLPSLKFENLL